MFLTSGWIGMIVQPFVGDSFGIEFPGAVLVLMVLLTILTVDPVHFI